MPPKWEGDSVDWAVVLHFHNASGALLCSGPRHWRKRKGGGRSIIWLRKVQKVTQAGSTINIGLGKTWMVSRRHSCMLCRGLCQHGKMLQPVPDHKHLPCHIYPLLQNLGNAKVGMFSQMDCHHLTSCSNGPARMQQHRRWWLPSAITLLPLHKARRCFHIEHRET